MDTKETCTVRFELSTYFQSTKKQDQYFKPSSYHKSIGYAKNLIDVVRKVISSQRCIYHVSIEEMIKSFFDKDTGCQHTIMAHDESMAAIIYARSQMPSKFVGIMHKTPKRFNIEAAKIKYMLPERGFTIYQKGKPPIHGSNIDKTMQIPIPPLNKPVIKALNDHTIALPAFMLKYKEAKIDGGEGAVPWKY